MTWGQSWSAGQPSEASEAVWASEASEASPCRGTPARSPGSWVQSIGPTARAWRVPGDRPACYDPAGRTAPEPPRPLPRWLRRAQPARRRLAPCRRWPCLLYTSDAADDLTRVDL